MHGKIREGVGGRRGMEARKKRQKSNLTRKEIKETKEGGGYRRPKNWKDTGA